MSKRKAASPLAKTLSWIPDLIRRDKRPSDANDKGRIEDLAGAIGDLVLAPTITNEPGKRKESAEYRSRAPTQSEGYNETRRRVDKPLPRPGDYDSRKDSKQYPPISPPSRRRAASVTVERIDTQLTWESQKVEMERLNRAQTTALAQKDADIQALKLENDRLSRRARESEQKARESGRELQAAADSRTHSEAAQLEETQRRCRKLERELEQTKKLLESRTEELSAAQAFVTTADQCSGADVCRLVEQLNDEFFQCAMDMSDALLQHRESSPASGNVRESSWRTQLQESRRLISKGWNEDTLVRLEADIARDDTVMFECMVQNAFVSEAREMIRSFCLENRDVDKHMGSLWKDIFASQDAAVAKNWLAITISTSRNQNRDHSQLLRYLHALLVVAGWREALNSRILEQVVHRRLVDMTAKAGKIRDMIYTGIRSFNIEIFCYEGGREFDPTTMQDAYEVPERQSTGGQEVAVGHGPIVCSTGLGLRIVTKRRRPSSGGSRREILMKPKEYGATAIGILLLLIWVAVCDRLFCSLRGTRIFGRVLFATTIDGRLVLAPGAWEFSAKLARGLLARLHLDHAIADGRRSDRLQLKTVDVSGERLGCL